MKKFSHLCLGLPSGFFPSGLPTKTLHAPLVSPIRATFHTPLILLGLTTLLFGYYNSKKMNQAQLIFRSCYSK